METAAPERLDAFMARANAAYYAGQDPFADFVTAPELSQAFGEVLGLWSAVVWQSMAAPVPVILAEAGPGRGTLMADALRAIGRMVPDFATALSVHLVETSARLRAVQHDRVPQAIWHDDVGELPPGPLLLLANEFFDALPIRQFVRRGAGWCERFVVGGGLVECPAEGPERDVPERDVPEGAVVEIGEAGRAIIDRLAMRLVVQGGAALLIDYGPAETAPGESLQALRKGRPADPLDRAGEADLTAHVDFADLARVARARGAAVHGPVVQGAFLAQLGFIERSRTLARSLPVRDAARLMERAQRLMEPDRMGQLFKVMALCHPELPTPPGFES